MPWDKGESGNPGGRPRENEMVKKLAREHTEESVCALVHWMKQRKDARASVAAAQALLDRGYGKPTQTLANDADNPITIPSTIVVKLEPTKNGQ